MHGTRIGWHSTVSFTGGPSQPGPWNEPVDGSGNAVLAGFSNWQAGTYTVQATYSGDSNYNGASAAPFSQLQRLRRFFRGQHPRDHLWHASLGYPT